MPILQDKVVLVTGAGTGIGRATALAMAEAGANVAAADIDLAAVQRTAGQAAGNARRAVALGADCGDVASIDAMVARTAAELGRLDVIVNIWARMLEAVLPNLQQLAPMDRAGGRHQHHVH